MSNTIVGLESLVVDPPAWVGRTRVGLLTHPPAVDRSFRSSVESVHRIFGDRLVRLFGPQHGFLGDKQDNMVESDDQVHPELGVEVISLYGRVRRPEPAMLADLDVLLVDLQDVGCRVYTFIHTLNLAMEACAEAGVKVVVLDRPNPIGRAVEGNVLDEDCFSFVGLFKLPMRHGLTIGEAARLFNTDGRGCDLEVIPCRNYDPTVPFERLGPPWVMPSPNMPALETAFVYPGQVLFEGSIVSEGRGTTRPFEMIGAPFIRPQRLGRAMAEYNLPGVVFRPINFEPTFHKFRGQLCGGVFLHITDRDRFKPYLTSLALLQAIHRLWPEHAKFTQPPYEYELERRPIDLILGRNGLADRVVDGVDLVELEAEWDKELGQFNQQRESILMYRG